MGEIKMETLRKQLKDGELERCYILYGQERYLREYYTREVRKAVLGQEDDPFNLRQYEGKDLDLTELSEAVDAYPSFAERTLVEVRDFDLFHCEEGETKQLIALLKELPDYCCLVFLFDTLEYKPDKRKKAVLGFMEEISAKYKHIGVESVEETLLRFEAMNYSSYERQDECNDYTLAAALWILDDLRKTGNLYKATEFLPKSFREIEDIYCRVNFYHPCYEDELVNSVMYVVDPENYTPEITIRRPYEGTKVYMPDFENPVMVVLSAYIEHGNVLKFEEVKCNVDGQELYLKTDYPDNPDNGYWYTTWTPSGEGSYNMTVSITQTGGKVTTASNNFDVTTSYDDIVVSALNGEMVVNTTEFHAFGEYPFPTHVNAFNAINLHYLHNCVNGNCNTYDHQSYLRVKNYRGEWVELCRYITPFGVECIDDLDVTDFTSVLQGLVEFEYYSEQYQTGDGYNPTAIFEYTKGTPEYPYVDMQELWYGNYSFGDYENLCPIPMRTVDFNPCVEKAKLQLTTSGHNWSDTGNGAYNTGNAAEFYEATHNININGATTYTQHLWENCTPNPAGCQPQNGTWTYPRAGWCPGSMTMVWDYSLDEYLPDGKADVLYEFDPTYVDQCHPNYPDCVSGQNSCPDCNNSSNPILKVSGKLVTYSHNTDILTEVPELPDVDAEPFQVSITPNPARGQMTITTDYDKGSASVLIINPQGAKVRGFSVKGSATIDVSDLPAGIYFVHVIGGKVVTRKVVIQK